MSTRAIYGFQDERSIYWVYVHHDGYPSGAAEKFARIYGSKLAWPLPRYEADEFAAGFIAVNKTSSGSVRLSHGPQDHGDLEYSYLVYRKGDTLRVKIGNGSAVWWTDEDLVYFIANSETVGKKEPD